MKLYQAAIMLNIIFMFTLIDSYIQEQEVIKYHIEDDILTIEIIQKLSDNDADSCLGDSVGEEEKLNKNIV